MSQMMYIYLCMYIFIYVFLCMYIFMYNTGYFMGVLFIYYEVLL